MKLDDFLISLGFDTSKLGSSIKEVEQKLSKVVDKSNKDALDSAKKTAKQRTKVELTEAEKLERARQQVKKQEEAKELRRRVRLEKDAGKATTNVQKQQQVQWAKQLGKEKNPQLKAMGNYYRKLQSDQTDVGNKSEIARRRRALGTLTNLQAFRDLKQDFGDEGRKAAAEYLRNAREALRKGNFDKVRDIRSSVTKKVRGGKFDSSELLNLSTRYAAGRGAPQDITNAFAGKMQFATSEREAKAYANALTMVSNRLNALDTAGKARLLAIVNRGDLAALTQFNKQLGVTSNEMRRAERRSIGLKAAQNGLVDSTRNMVRQYASMYAVFAGTTAINRVGQDFEAMNSSMLAAMGTKRQAQEEVKFLTELTSRLGMSTLDAADSYGKFVFASKGKLDTEQVRELFTGLSEMGTALGISKDRMKLSQVAIQQINGLPLQ